jgi:hypothetical protein
MSTQDIGPVGPAEAAAAAAAPVAVHALLPCTTQWAGSWRTSPDPDVTLYAVSANGFAYLLGGALEDV